MAVSIASSSSSLSDASMSGGGSSISKSIFSDELGSVLGSRGILEDAVLNLVFIATGGSAMVPSVGTLVLGSWRGMSLKISGWGGVTMIGFLFGVVNTRGYF